MLYASYADTCLSAVPLLADRDARVIHREMAAEWLMLADQALMLAGPADQVGTQAPQQVAIGPAPWPFS